MGKDKSQVYEGSTTIEKITGPKEHQERISDKGGDQGLGDTSPRGYRYGTKPQRLPENS